MPKRLVILFFIVLTLLSCYSFADIIYLKNGDIIRGEIMEEDDYSLTVKEKDVIKNIRAKDIKDIKTYEDIKNENDVQGEAMYDLEERLGENSLEFVLGPEFGIYNLKESTVSKYHKNGLIVGINVNLWIKKKDGVQFGFESYDNTFTGSVLVRNTSTGLSALNRYSERLSLMPFWLSYLHMLEEQPFYVGAGIGMVMVNLNMTTGITENNLKDDFPAYQFMLGYIYKKIGLEFKYSVIETNEYWQNSNYGGYSLLFNLYF